MATRPKRWPNNAEYARMTSVAHALKIEQTLRPVLDGAPMTEVEKLRRIANAIIAAAKIAQELERVK